MNKRGQIFILAAVIISVVLITLTTVFNYAQIEEKPKNLYELTDNIKKEGFEVIDYSLYSSKEGVETLRKYTDNISDYILNVEPEAEFLFVYGNLTNIRLEDYTNNDISSSISLQIGKNDIISRTSETLKDYRRINATEITPDGDSINITIGSYIHQIKLNKGENFIVIMKKTNKNNTYVYLE